jgi:FtsP/CotA-like multicopper oxidase with cupredoxin domain
MAAVLPVASTCTASTTARSGQPMQVADMVPDDVGTWLYHCHVNDHITAGMQALYTVTS